RYPDLAAVLAALERALAGDPLAEDEAVAPSRAQPAEPPSVADPSPRTGGDDTIGFQSGPLA
ncbi:MAG: hypothetical protein AB1758_15145, partial [Candidatus Eremiobacterota bacterium]